MPDHEVACSADLDPHETLVIAPEPADWVEPTVAALRQRGPVHVVAPWALPSLLTRWAAPLAFVRRRRVDPDPHTSWFPGFLGAELALRIYGRGRAHRQYAARFAVRNAVDRLVGLGLGGGRWSHADSVVAPTLAARRTFAAARTRGLPCILIEDLPDLDTLGQTLDTLTESYPHCPFLANHRPARGAIVKQRSERELADVIGVRGGFAWQRLHSRFAHALVAVPRVATDPPPPMGSVPSAPPSSEPRVGPPVVLLAGPAVGRSGTMHLGELATRLPEVVFVVQATTPTEPSDLLTHPRIRIASGPQLDLVGVSAVLSLSGVECHPPAIRRALATGVPVVGTAASLGQVAPRSAHLVAPHQTDAIAAALREALLPRARRPHPWSPPRSLAQWAARPA